MVRQVISLGFVARSSPDATVIGPWGRLEEAHRVFEEMPEPDSVSWTAMIVGIIRWSVWALGGRFTPLWLSMGLSSYISVANSLLNMYAKSGDPVTAKIVFDRMKLKSTSSWNTMISSHMQSGLVDLAQVQFEQMIERDVVSWNAMISGYNQHGFDREALDIFSKMLMDSSSKPDKFTLASALSACANLENLKLGKQIHAHIIRTEFDTFGAVGNALISIQIHASATRSGNASSVSVSNALITMYAKSGSINDARWVFNLIHWKRDTITWTSMIIALAQHGLGEEALTLFERMLENGIKPDHITYVGVLSACTHVDCLGFALASCKVHKNVELAEVAAERKSMKDKGVKKDQGFSWVQIKNKVHIFGVDDGLHPQRDAIYEMMAKIWKEIKKMGFVPDTESVLHDLEEELKEQILSHHSEKLAIAFGLICTPENTTLRIMKNLRVCNDCHSAIKSMELGKRSVVQWTSQWSSDFMGIGGRFWDKHVGLLESLRKCNSLHHAIVAWRTYVCNLILRIFSTQM
ncbi:Pentatricopeptide repeat-containing protein [Vitis vinifera]|uniref:Pentatricopeptide repeat-containing protein n=1 Tax=Vitis vinifera TaxID=29760 RepID=A0A438F5A6_VITVI|nr:Pentatricopeptide repeat-containing protein [Vitis vinifera]